MTKINIVKIVGLTLLASLAVYTQYRPEKARPRLEAHAEAIPAPEASRTPGIGTATKEVAQAFSQQEAVESREPFELTEQDSPLDLINTLLTAPFGQEPNETISEKSNWRILAYPPEYCDPPAYSKTYRRKGPGMEINLYAYTAPSLAEAKELIMSGEVKIFEESEKNTARDLLNIKTQERRPFKEIELTEVLEALRAAGFEAKPTENHLSSPGGRNWSGVMELSKGDLAGLWYYEPHGAGTVLRIKLEHRDTGKYSARPPTVKGVSKLEDALPSLIADLEKNGAEKVLGADWEEIKPMLLHGPNIKVAGPGHVTIVHEDMDYATELARQKYFFDELSTAPATSQSYKPVRINAITRFKNSLYFTGQEGENGAIIRLGLKNDNPAAGDWEIIKNISGRKLSPITFSEIESGGLRIYTPAETYAYDGKAWSRTSGADARYFRPEKDPCSNISTDEIFKDFTLYEKCDKERHTQGDAALVGYEGRCETDNPGKYTWLHNSYTGILERYALAARLIDISKTPLRRFFVWNSAAGYEAVTGIYDIKGNSCKFYPMPVPGKDILKRYRPDRAEHGCGLNDKLGPFQKLGDRIWFCKDFYGGEGQCGVGAAGFFDTKARVFEILYSSQTAKWSCSAILAEENTVWMGLQHIGEGSVSSGGLAAVNPATGEAVIHEVPSGISAIQRTGASIILGGDEGIYTLNTAGQALFLGPDIDEDGNYQLNFQK